MTDELLTYEDHFGARNYAPLDVTLRKGRGVWVWDTQGRRYLDGLAAYSAVNQGHCHPEIIKTLCSQARKLTLTGRAFRNDQLGLFCRDICTLTKSEAVLPMNTGAEAVESAIKLVRKWGYTVKGVQADRAEIIICANNFHGRTTTVVGFSSDPKSREGFGPFAPGFIVVPFGDAAAIEAAITKNTVAVLIEPIQGEAGVVIPPNGYLKAVRSLCTTHEIVMILDEIQTGLGRTGRLLAEEHEGVEADMTLVGKALSGGVYPVSAVLSNRRIMAVLNPGEHGSTFGGNPLACAVARTALRVLVEDDMISNASRIGSHLLQTLRSIDSPNIQIVRGRGLMLAIDLEPGLGGARRVCEQLARMGVLCKDTHDNTIRFSPPLTLTREEADWAVERIADAIL